jgi:hypothetical protein
LNLACFGFRSTPRAISLKSRSTREYNEALQAILGRRWRAPKCFLRKGQLEISGWRESAGRLYRSKRPCGATPILRGRSVPMVCVDVFPWKPHVGQGPPRSCDRLPAPISFLSKLQDLSKTFRLDLSTNVRGSAASVRRGLPSQRFTADMDQPIADSESLSSNWRESGSDLNTPACGFTNPTARTP